MRAASARSPASLPPSWSATGCCSGSNPSSRSRSPWMTAPRGHHFRIEQGMARDQTQEEPVVPIGPVHHRCNREPMFLIIFHYSHIATELAASIRTLFCIKLHTFGVPLTSFAHAAQRSAHKWRPAQDPAPTHGACRKHRLISTNISSPAIQTSADCHHLHSPWRDILPRSTRKEKSRCAN